MAYTRTDVISGDAVEAEVIDGNIVEFREAIQTTKLQSEDLVEGTIKTENIIRPDFTIRSMNSFEWRGVSGGMAVIKKPIASLTPMEDQAIISKSSSYPDQDESPAPASRPANSGISRVLHQSVATGTTMTGEGQPYLPGMALTIDFDKECEVMVRAKLIHNYLPNSQTGASPLLGFHRAGDQFCNLVITMPDGSEITTAAGMRRSFRTQLSHDLRQIYITYQFRINSGDIVFQDKGTYHIGIKGALRPTPGTTDYPAGCRNKYESSIALSGKSTLSVEWWNTE